MADFMESHNGHKYKGCMSPTNMPIVYGEMTYPTGDVWKGEYKNGQPEGQGEWRFPDGRIFTGEIRE